MSVLNCLFVYFIFFDSGELFTDKLVITAEKILKSLAIIGVHFEGFLTKNTHTDHKTHALSFCQICTYT